MGLLIYRFDSDTTVASNKLADHLLPHLSLNKIAAMADRHRGRCRSASITPCTKCRWCAASRHPTLRCS